MEYDVKKVEERWQRFWEERGLFKTKSLPKKKYYVLVMYPYPSGDLHMGHIKNYVIGDVIARYKRLQGYDVLHPFGWDAFGLPAENAAILHNIPPEKWTKENIEVSRRSLKLMGIGYDWDAEVTTCEPDYYKWNQWIFLKFYERGLAYRKDAYVNFCPGCQTVLANEQVIEGRCFRCSSIIEKKRLTQWFFRITDYAERLLEGLDRLKNWPLNVKEMQRNWIGKSEGCEVDFRLEGSDKVIPVFTTRPDTLFGATFIAVAPDSDLAMEIAQGRESEEFIKRVLRTPEIERTALGREKEGVFTGKYAINPVNGERIPIWIADYVLASYGTGAIMAVPAHDQRDFEFAKKYKLPIRVVINPPGEELNPEEMEEAYTEEGVMVNSKEFDTLPSKEGIRRITDFLSERGKGRKKVNYRLKDWLISRQRYWGTPIPMVHCERCGIVPVPEKELPVLLPKGDIDYLPKGKSPLEGVEEFINTKCPKCGGPAKRDPDTMDTFVDSSWYFLRYLDPHNDKEPFRYEATKLWLPIDQYIGGIEHATGHLIYFRFFTKVFYDMGLVAVDEPADSLFTQGMVLLKGRVMSSSKRHGVWVGPFVERYGADVARITILFAGPPQRDMEWSDKGVKGSIGFLNRVYRLFNQNIERVKANPIKPSGLNKEERKLYIRLNQTIKKVTEDTEVFQFNTAIASLMEFLNELYAFKDKTSPVFGLALYRLIHLLAPFAPHLAEELWHLTGNTGSVFEKGWPLYDSSFILSEEMVIPVQVDGRLRAKLTVARDTSEEEIKNLALSNEKVKRYIEGREISRIIYVPEKLINIVMKRDSL